MPARMTLERAHTEGFELVRLHTARFADAVLGLSADEIARPVPGMDWTVGEVVAHVQSVYERYTIDHRRAPSVVGVAVQNQSDVERLGVDPVAAAASMREQVEVLATVVPHVAPDRLFPFHAGSMTTMAGGWGNLLGELLAHGDDIARATRWGFTMPGRDLEVTCCHTLPVLSRWLVSEESGDASWDLVFEFGTVQLRFVGGSLLHGVDDDLPPLPSHHAVKVHDPGEFLLVMPYRRRPPQDEATALLLSRFAPV